MDDLDWSMLGEAAINTVKGILVSLGTVSILMLTVSFVLDLLNS